MIKHAIKNGEIIEEKDASVSIVDRSVQANFSVYEALRVIDSKVVYLQDHIKRLEYSASQIKLKLENYDFLTWINKLIEIDNINSCSLRIIVYGGLDSNCFITWTPLLSYPTYYYEEGISVITYHGERYLPTCKTSNLLLSYLSLEEAKLNNSFEALLVNNNNRVLEGSRSNFFAIKEGKLYTADNSEVLEGITRKYILEAAKVLNLEIVYEAIDENDIYSYDAVFISSTSMLALPISSVNGKKVKMDKIVLKFKELLLKWEHR